MTITSKITAIASAAGIGASLIVGAILPGSPAQAASAPSYPGQIITVSAAHSYSQTAVLQAWQRNSSGGYTRVYGPTTAHVGGNGVNKTREGDLKTPTGVFSMTQAFGNHSNPGTRMPYFKAGPSDWWNENSHSSQYNHHVVQRSNPGGDSENINHVGYAYDYAVNINYNTYPVRAGKGSAIFLHVSDNHWTAGCISIGYSQMIHVLKWLNPSQHPVISIGTGSQATAIIARDTVHPVAPHPVAMHPTGNLLVNPGAESSATVSTGWSSYNEAPRAFSRTMRVSSAAGNRGRRMFAGGKSSSADMGQVVLLSRYASAIASGRVRFTMSGWLGGYSHQNDRTLVNVTFLNSSGYRVGSTAIAPVTAAQRRNVTSLLFRSRVGVVPRTARTAIFAVESIRAAGVYDDGYADNLSFRLA